MRTLRLLQPVSLAHCVRFAIPTLRLVHSLPPLSDALAEGQGCLKRDPRPLAWWQLETADLPGSCEDPVDGSLGSWAPVGAERQAVTACRRGPRLCQERGLPTRKVSRLDVQAFHLAVYASQGGSPRRHARLASGCWPALPGGIGYPQGPYGWFPRCNRYISSSLPQALPGAMTPFLRDGRCLRGAATCPFATG
jgi:hypothetical protein